MREEYFWAAFVLVWVFGWAIVWLRRRKAQEALVASRREMLHRERMAAMEKGLPWPEIPVEGEALPDWLSEEVERARARWLVRWSLVLGWVAVTTGIGICLGFYLAPDRGFRGMWTIGLIPFMGGVGFLIAAWAASRWERGDPS